MNSLSFPRPPCNTRVIVAMSGGVDSSVVAGLLVEQGYDVVGMTLQLYDHGAATSRKGACCAGQDIHDARTVADHLGIPHYVLDYENRFAQAVIEDFADSYQRGETPIPCVRCNQRIKFRDLLDTARDLGADVLATGHYVRRIDGPAGPELHRAADAAKDQSYFLFATTPEQLAFLRFPLGTLSKAETRAHAARLRLPVAEKPESQDICFVPSGHYAGVVEKLRPSAAEPGDIVHIDGRVLGRHDGIIHFTIGQRRGLGVGGRADESPEPLYVVRLDAACRQVIVGPRPALARNWVWLREINWLGDTLLSGARRAGEAVAIKLRSTQPPVAATVMVGPDGTAELHLHRPQEGVAPGQAAVFYRGDRVLGGGWIAATALHQDQAALQDPADRLDTRPRQAIYAGSQASGAE